MIYSLAMVVRVCGDGAIEISAPWLDVPVRRATWEEAYEAAMRARAKRAA